MKKIGLFGAGGMAREAAAYCDASVEFFAVDREYIESNSRGLIDICKPDESEKHTPVVSALGAPAVRMAMIEKWPGNNYGQIVAADAKVMRAELGEGVILAPGSIITTDVSIGDHTIVNIGATISHDCKIGRFVTVGPGARIAGGVELGDGVFVGIGATINNDVKIANGVVVGAGAVVIRDIVQENSVVVGVPAKIITRNESWLHEF